MYTLIYPFLILSTLQCCVWTHGEFYERYTNPEDFGTAYQENNGRRNIEYRPNTAPIRHTHTSTRINKPELERVESRHNAQTTVRNYVNPVSTNIRQHVNNSSHPNNNQSQNNKNSKRKSEALVEESRMIYPSDMENLTLFTSADHVKSRECSYGLCDEVDNYPLEKIERILNRSELRKFFSTETINFEPRFGDGENLCSTITHTRFPKTAKNMQNKEQVIVNVDQYKQGVVFETCTEEGPCNYSENFPNNFTPKCVQKYTVRKLMVLGKESDETVFDDFKIPSCCVCMIWKK